MPPLINRKKTAGRITLIAVFSLLLFTAGAPHRFLTIYNAARRKTVLKLPAEDVRKIQYCYQQSYDRGFIEESFILENCRIVPVQMVYDTDSYDFHGSRYPDAEHEKKENRNCVYIRNHEGYPEIKYRIGYIIKQEMKITMKNSETSFSFPDLGEPGNLLILRVTQ